MISIWPSRVIRLVRRSRGGYGEAWLSDDRVQEIVAAVTSRRQRNLLDKPVVLDGGTVRQLALVLLGDDGVAHGSVLLRVTNERFYSEGPCLRLTIVPYGPVAGSGDRPRLLPGAAGDLLDDLVEQLRVMLGADVDRSDDED